MQEIVSSNVVFVVLQFVNRFAVKDLLPGTSYKIEVSDCLL